VSRGQAPAPAAELDRRSRPGPPASPLFLSCAFGLALVVALTAATPAGAQGDPASPRLTLAQAAEAALASFPGIAASRARGEAARAEAAEAKAARRPSLLLGASGTEYQEPSLVTPIHGFSLDQLPEFERTLFQGSLRLTYTLWDGGGREARIDQLASQAEAAGVAISSAEQAVVARVASAYLAVLGHAEVLAAEGARLEALEAEGRRVKQLFEAGRSAQVEVKRAEAAVAAARADRAVRAARLAEAERELARLVGREAAETRAGDLVPVALRQGGPGQPEGLPAQASPDEAEAPATSEDPAGEKRPQRHPVARPTLPDREILRQRALAGSPAIEEARRRLDAARAALALAESGRSPSLQAVAQELGFGSREGHFVGEWNAGVQVSVPLWTGGATEQRIARARAAAAAAEADVQLAELEAEARLDVALVRVEEASALQESLGAAVESLAEVVRIERLRQEAGAGVQTDYLEAEAQLLAARAARVEAHYGEIAARVELARVVGELSPAWLSANLLDQP